MVDVGEAGGGRDVRGGIKRGGQVRMVTCGGCGREMRAGNLARHQRGACRVWDPGGGGQTLDGGRWPDGWWESGHVGFPAYGVAVGHELLSRAELGEGTSVGPGIPCWAPEMDDLLDHPAS